MGSGFKDFAPGDILTAADVDGYLMRQTVMTFADASARDTALSGVLDEGMVAYLEDSDYFTVYDGSAWQVFSNTPAYELVTFTSSGTFTKASYPWGKSVRVRVVGGGGGSGGCEATGAGEISIGAGGGGGGYAEERLAMSALSASETVTIGAGGAGGAAGLNNGSTGGATVFGSFLTGSGGGGGGGGAAATPDDAVSNPGGGGAASGGDINVGGDFGRSGFAQATNRLYRSFGGGSVLGQAGGGNIVNQTGADAVAGDNYGGGATGPVNGPSLSSRAGAAGGAGVVIVEIFG